MFEKNPVNVSARFDEALREKEPALLVVVNVARNIGYILPRVFWPFGALKR